MPQQLGDASPVFGGNEQPAGPAKDGAIFLACLTHRRGVHQGHHFFQVIDQHAIEQDFIAILKRAEGHVPLEIVVLAVEILQHAVDLHVLRQDRGGQQASQAERLPLGLGEGRAFVQYGVVEHLDPSIGVGFPGGFRRAADVRHGVGLLVVVGANPRARSTNGFRKTPAGSTRWHKA